MLELPETKIIARQLNEIVAGKRVAGVLPPNKPHKFCWFSDDPAAYAGNVTGSTISGAEGFGIFVEIRFDNGLALCFNDGVNVRFIAAEALPKAYQLVLLLEGGQALAFTVAMYGGIILHGEDYAEEYYLKSRAAISPFSSAFETYFFETLKNGAPGLSAKAFLATQQRFPGIGNGVLQDILLAAGIPPKRKIGTLDEEEKRKLFSCVVWVLKEMTEGGGRDTEKDLFGREGGYPVKLSKKTLACGCPVCGGGIVKETYLGGAVYYCPHCQPMK